MPKTLLEEALATDMAERSARQALDHATRRNFQAISHLSPELCQEYARITLQRDVDADSRELRRLEKQWAKEDAEAKE